MSCLNTTITLTLKLSIDLHKICSPRLTSHLPWGKKLVQSSRNRAVDSGRSPGEEACEAKVIKNKTCVSRIMPLVHIQGRICQIRGWIIVPLACVTSVSVGFSVRSRHFSLFGGTKIGASTTLMEGAAIFARSKSEKCFKPAESYTETFAPQAIVTYVNLRWRVGPRLVLWRWSTTTRVRNASRMLNTTKRLNKRLITWAGLATSAFQVS